MLKHLFIRKSLVIVIILFLISCNLLNLARSPEPTPTNTSQPPSDTPPITDTLPPTPTAAPTDTPTPQPTPTITLTSTPQLPSAGPFRGMAVVGELLAGSVVNLEFFPETGLWLITTGGAARFDGENWQVMLDDLGGRIMVGLSSQGWIWALSPDYSRMEYWDSLDGSWYSTEGWKKVDDPYFPIKQRLQTDVEGKMWYATTEDVRYYDGSTWRIFSPKDMLMFPFINQDAIHVFTLSPFPYTAEVWVGQCDWIGPGPGGGLGARWWDGNRWQGATAPVKLGCVYSITPDLAGNRVWVGVDSVLWRFDRETSKWTSIPTPPKPESGMRLGAIIDIAIAADGSLWVTYLACGGASCSTAYLYVYQNDQWQPLVIEGREIYDARVLVDYHGKAWVFTSGAGVCEVVDGKLVPLAELEPVSFIMDDLGRIWISGSQVGGPEMIWMAEPANP